MYRIYWKEAGEVIAYARTLATAKKHARTLAKQKRSEMCVRTGRPLHAKGCSNKKFGCKFQVKTVACYKP